MNKGNQSSPPGIPKDKAFAMSQSRNITNFFRPPSTSSKNENQSSSSPANSRPTSFCPPHVPPPHSQTDTSPDQAGGVSNDGVDKSHQDFMSTSQGGSFNSSQRVFKNGKVVVTSSDGDDTDSLSSTDDPDDLLRMFTTSASPALKEEDKREHPEQPSDRSRAIRSTNKKKLSTSTALPTYKFTLDSLVTESVDDNEVEANIAKLRQALESSQNDHGGAQNGEEGQTRKTRQEMLASAVGLEENDSDFQRLVDAVNRTDAFSQEHSWSFLDDNAHQQAPESEPFPDGLPPDDPAVMAMKDPDSRERIVYSAYLNTSFSRNALPDELILWVLNSIPCEPRNHIRYAYCRAFDFAPQEWISSRLRPNHIEKLFQKLGARPVALNLSETLEYTYRSNDENALSDRRCLISVISLLGRLAKRFANDTREYALKILLRLTLDDNLMNDCQVCPEAENAIAALCREAIGQSTDACIPHVTKNIFETIQEPELRAQLLKHINPVTTSISLVRCRLALSFFFKDPLLLDAPVDQVFGLNRISTRLADKQFNFSRLKAQRDQAFNWGELAATTTFLDIGICPETASFSSSAPSSSSTQLSPEAMKTQKAAEAQFNDEVDILASRLKAVFSSIEDTGASHLKRTETKESLEALYYRILYTVRTKPQPKRVFFSSKRREEWNGMGRSGALMDRFFSTASNDTEHNDEDSERPGENAKAEEDIPIREHTTE